MTESNQLYSFPAVTRNEKAARKETARIVEEARDTPSRPDVPHI